MVRVVFHSGCKWILTPPIHQQMLFQSTVLAVKSRCLKWVDDWVYCGLLLYDNRDCEADNNDNGYHCDSDIINNNNNNNHYWYIIFFSIADTFCVSWYGHVMMSVMLMSTLARWCHESWQHAHNTVNDISHSECSVLINFTSSLKWSSFQSKGADRKLKVEMQKLEHKAKEELVR